MKFLADLKSVLMDLIVLKQPEITIDVLGFLVHVENKPNDRGQKEW